MQISILGTDGAYLANDGSNAISILGPDGNLLPNDGTNFVCVTGSDGAYQPNDGTREAFSILGTDGALKPYEEGNSFSVLDENGSLAMPSTDNLISLLLWGGAQGAWYDPSDLSTMQQAYNYGTPVSATGQGVGIILDKSLGLAQTPNLMTDPDTGVMTPVGASAPTFSTTTHLGVACRQLVFNMPTGAGGYGVSRADTAAEGSMPVAPGALNVSFEVSLSRALTGGEVLSGFAVAPTDAYTIEITAANSAALVGAWGRRQAYKMTTPGGAAQFSFYTGGTWVSGNPLTVYIRAVVINKVLGNHAYQTTSGSRPIFRDIAGVRYLEFDGVDDYLRATFTIAQPIDRISAIQQVTWTNSDRVFGGVTAYGAILYQSGGSPNLTLYSGTGGAVVAPALATNGVITERHNGASSRAALNSGAYSTGNVGTNVPGGITLGAAYTNAEYGNFHLHQLIMRGSTTAMTDAQVSTCRALCAIKSGVTL